MNVQDLINYLLECNPDAVVEVRGDTREGYIVALVEGVDNQDDLVILDI